MANKSQSRAPADKPLTPEEIRVRAYWLSQQRGPTTSQGAPKPPEKKKPEESGGLTGWTKKIVKALGG